MAKKPTVEGLDLSALSIDQKKQIMEALSADVDRSRKAEERRRERLKEVFDEAELKRQGILEDLQWLRAQERKHKIELISDDFKRPFLDKKGAFSPANFWPPIAD